MVKARFKAMDNYVRGRSLSGISLKSGPLVYYHRGYVPSHFSLYRNEGKEKNRGKLGIQN